MTEIDNPAIEGVMIDSEADAITNGTPVQIELADGRVVVAVTKQIQTGDYSCPVDGCLRRFESERARNIHVGSKHPETRARDCVGCGESFQPTNADQSYCSRDCWAANGEPGRESTVRETRVCPECGDEFETYPSEDNTYCSTECHHQSRRDVRDCATCGDEFEIKASSPNERCSRQCAFEDRRGGRDGSPTEMVDELLAEFADEGTNTTDDALVNVVGRAHANLNPRREWEGDRLDVALLVAIRTTDDIEALLDRTRALIDAGAVLRGVEMDGDVADLSDADIINRAYRTIRYTNDNVPRHGTGMEWLNAIEGSETLLEVAQQMRCDRSVARVVAQRLGVRDSLAGQADSPNTDDDLMERARERLGIDNGETQDDTATDTDADVPAWKRVQQRSRGD